MNFYFGDKVGVKKDVDHLNSLWFTKHQFARSFVTFSKQNLYHDGNNEHSHTYIYILPNFTFPHFLWPFPRRNVHGQWNKEKDWERTFGHFFFLITENTAYSSVALIFYFSSALSWAVLPTNIKKMTFFSISLTSWSLDMVKRAGTLTFS